jgi:hypothetical protein
LLVISPPPAAFQTPGAEPRAGLAGSGLEGLAPRPEPTKMQQVMAGRVGTLATAAPGVVGVAIGIGGLVGTVVSANAIQNAYTYSSCGRPALGVGLAGVVGSMGAALVGVAGSARLQDYSDNARAAVNPDPEEPARRANDNSPV